MAIPPASQQQSAKQKLSLSGIILLTKGAFVTPRSVVKNMTVKQRPQAEKVIEEMKSLEEMEIGTVKTLARSQTVFYKPTPCDSNKDSVTKVIGDNWDIYERRFKEVDTMYMTTSQHNRLLISSPNEDELKDFGIVERSDEEELNECAIVEHS